MNDTARFFVAVYGDPGEGPDKDLVESGRYVADPKYAPFDIKSGDIILLYCTAAYKVHSKRVPGAGRVQKVQGACIEYEWIPFAEPITRDEIRSSFEPDDARKLKNIRFSFFWLFEISRESFSRAVGSRQFEQGSN